ncbi:hypothetical protein JJB11_21615 [Ramlibacter ginsenosidimutans]|uniref:Uncharacterized protein n=1 Tax=Ramlibacter ginsenosidimutans TaxID=502333 RepID=A0A934WPN0_9BURK|nr:hypothetical protein [Ramlibacter ginsenosidimutans]MBK6008706.1 hypothetical protein [Ramlibacter ginsenosidimutans]
MPAQVHREHNIASKTPPVAAALKLLDELSSAQKTLHAMNEDLLRATVENCDDLPALRELVVAQHSRVQAITEQMIEALRDT